MSENDRSDANDSPHDRPSANDPFDGELRSLIDGGRLLDAIKLYRARTGAGLSEAKAAIEALAKGTALPSHQPSLGDGPISPDADAEVVELLRQNQKIAAIRLYRTRMQVGLKHAKEAVEAIADEHGLTVDQPGCVAHAPSLLVLLGIVAALFLFAALVLMG